MTTHSKWFACAAAAMLLTVTASAQDAGADAKAKPAIKYGPVTGNAVRGKDLFHAHTCYGCHGFNGETGARDLVGTNSPVLATEDTFVHFLRLRGNQAPVLPTQTMPNYSETSLPDKDAKDIYAYIRSFHLDSPAVKDTPTLRKILKMADDPYKP